MKCTSLFLQLQKCAGRTLLGVMALTLLIGFNLAPAPAAAGIYVSITEAPPELPVYDPPPLPGEGYMWTPGYWAWDEEEGDYYWVPGAWVMAPQPGYLWTPGYWGWNDGVYAWNAGYWGPTVGYYGGVCYGYGYTGQGFHGGHWDHGAYYYNRSVVNIGNVRVTRVYSKPVSHSQNKISFNGGPRGLQLKPTEQERLLATHAHLGPTAAQKQHHFSAHLNKGLFFKANRGNPTITGVAKPGQFSGPGVSGAKPGFAGAGKGPGGAGQASSLGKFDKPGGKTISKGLSKPSFQNTGPGKPFNTHRTYGNQHWKPSGNGLGGSRSSTMGLSRSRPAGNQTMHFPRGGPSHGGPSRGGPAHSAPKGNGGGDKKHW
jgi:hypothetical protein